MNIEEYINEARCLLNNYSAEIPNEIVFNAHKTYKISKGWFQNIGGVLDLATDEGIVNQTYSNLF